MGPLLSPLRCSISFYLFPFFLFSRIYFLFFLAFTLYFLLFLTFFSFLYSFRSLCFSLILLFYLFPSIFLPFIYSINLSFLPTYIAYFSLFFIPCSFAFSYSFISSILSLFVFLSFMYVHYLRHSRILSSSQRGPWDHRRGAYLPGRWRHQPQLYVWKIISTGKT